MSFLKLLYTIVVARQNFEESYQYCGVVSLYVEISVYLQAKMKVPTTGIAARTVKVPIAKGERRSIILSHVIT